MRIEEMFQPGKPVLSFEIFPPKRNRELEEIDDTLKVLCELEPDFISVTFGAGGSGISSRTVELAKKIRKDYHVEPLVHLTCLNYTKREICEILDELKEAGLENILALRGDRNPDAEPKQDFRYASDLVTFIREYGGFHISGACYPEGHMEAENQIQDIRNLKHKVDEGVSHLVSQLFFDNEFFYGFQEKARIAGIDVPIEAGIMPVINKAQIERMVSLCGASLPPKFRRIMSKYENRRDALFDAGMAYAVSQIVELLSNDVDGIHIFTMNNPKVAKRICSEIRNLI
ncbi:methylenetetrahydrofolate reductase [NAD(P)H] [Diplocloster modestus]|uniref:Methylenetetrahydrofolate reductase n=1 Tax=Diplocloster modestus TaxID=2850322 RepID=A0ABS6KCS9_9FIRM|nr:methylenetetrahydrofolate reductase [NAD(P)H] [Diplocloster modestus]MBU9728322.1 methylenetetrahydrofolate reductase [NAD(P)H] [Diplocloster modestus]